MIAILTKLTGNFELSGQIISIFFSTIAVIPLYLLGKKVYNEKVSFIAVLFYSINPYLLRYTIDVLREGTFIFFYFCAKLKSWEKLL